VAVMNVLVMNDLDDFLYIHTYYIYMHTMTEWNDLYTHRRKIRRKKKKKSNLSKRISNRKEKRNFK